MASAKRTPSFGPSLETLRRYHPTKYRRWVWVGVIVSTLGYTASSLSFVVQRSWSAALATGDPFVVLCNVVALAALVRGHPRSAAGIALAAAFIDAHYSLVVLRMPTLGNVGFILPGFILAAGLFFGGRVAMWAAGLLMVSAPATLWVASLFGAGAGLDDRAVKHFLVVL